MNLASAKLTQLRESEQPKDQGWPVGEAPQYGGYEKTEHQQRVDECAEEATKVIQDNHKDDTEAPEQVLAWHLLLVLPMAKGYAKEHPYGKNQEIVNRAAEILDAFGRAK